MDYRRDVLPPLVGLVLSLLLHVAMLGVGIPLWPEPPPELDRITVEYLEPGAGGGEAAPDPAIEEEDARQPQEEPQSRDTPAPPPDQDTESRPPPPPAPSTGTPEPAPDPGGAGSWAPAPAPTPVPQAPPPVVVPLPPEPSLEPATSPSAGEASAEAGPEPPEPSPPAPPLALQDLLPRAGDLTDLAEPRTLPDPTAEGAQEATLALGETDVRYRGYLDQVQAAVDVTWRWKEAIMEAGRGGSVLVRFTIAPGGGVENVEVVESPGGQALAREAVEAVRRARLPHFPRHWTIERLHLFAQFDYRLE